MPETATMPPLLLSRRAAAKALDLSVPTLDRLVSRGELHPVRIGQLVRFDVQDLRNFIDSRKTEFVSP